MLLGKQVSDCIFVVNLLWALGMGFAMEVFGCKIVEQQCVVCEHKGCSVPEDEVWFIDQQGEIVAKIVNIGQD